MTKSTHCAPEEDARRGRRCDRRCEQAAALRGVSWRRRRRARTKAGLAQAPPVEPKPAAPSARCISLPPALGSSGALKEHGCLTHGAPNRLLAPLDDDGRCERCQQLSRKQRRPPPAPAAPTAAPPSRRVAPPQGWWRPAAWRALPRPAPRRRWWPGSASRLSLALAAIRSMCGGPRRARRSLASPHDTRAQTPPPHARACARPACRAGAPTSGIPWACWPPWRSWGRWRRGLPRPKRRGAAGQGHGRCTHHARGGEDTAQAGLGWLQAPARRPHSYLPPAASPPPTGGPRRCGRRACWPWQAPAVPFTKA